MLHILLEIVLVVTITTKISHEYLKSSAKGCQEYFLKMVEITG